MELAVEVVRDYQFVRQLRAEWNDLLAVSCCNNIFLTWEWVYSYLEAYAEVCEPYIVVVRAKDGSLRGLAPFVRVKSRVAGLIPHARLEFAGRAISSDYLDIVVRKGEAEAIYDLIFKHLLLRRKTDFDTICLNEVLESSSLAQYLSGPVGRCQIRVTRELQCPFISLPATPQALLGGLSKKKASNVRYYSRYIFERLGGAFGVVQDGDCLGESVDKFIELHLNRWHDPSQPQHYTNPRVKGFTRIVTKRLFERGWLRLFYVQVDAQIVSMLYGMAYGDTFYYYKSGFDPEWGRLSPGVVVLSESIQHCIQEALSEFDFLRGMSAYKIYWANGTRRMFTYVLERRAVPNIVVGFLRIVRRVIAEAVRLLLPEAVRSRIRRIVPERWLKVIHKLIYSRM